MQLVLEQLGSVSGVESIQELSQDVFDSVTEAIHILNDFLHYEQIDEGDN